MGVVLATASSVRGGAPSVLLGLAGHPSNINLFIYLFYLNFVFGGKKKKKVFLKILYYIFSGITIPLCRKIM